jgi:endonuclease/exonuclease/phosphatase (EEP) superfamily protein YafD
MAYRLARAAGWLLIALLTAVAVVRWGGLDTFTPAVQVLMVTPYLVLAAVLAVIVLVATGRRRLAAYVGVVGVALLVSVLPRWGVTPPAVPSGGTRLTVMSVNLGDGGADPAGLVARVRQQHPDVLSVQQLTPDAARRLRAAGLDDLLPHQVLRAAAGAAGSGLYAREALSRAGRLDGTGFDQARAELTTAAGPVRLVAVNVRPPNGPGAVAGWRSDLSRLPAGDGPGPSVLAGDFNATLDNSALRTVLDGGYADAAAGVGAGLRATWFGWPAPPLVTDHVLADHRVVPRALHTYPLAGTDHRIVVAELYVKR